MPRIELATQSNGLLVDVRIGLSAARRELLWKRGMEVPPAVLATFVVDTGADTTMVSDQVMRTLQLTPTGQANVLTSASQGIPEPCSIYDVQLEFLNKSGDVAWLMQPLAVLARPLLNQATDGMIGRDVLDHCVLEYDGPGRVFRLSYG